MTFFASVLEPYLSEEGRVLWRSPIPVVIVAKDLEEAVESLSRLYPIRNLQIERKLLEEYPNWPPGAYREAAIVALPLNFKGAVPIFLHIAENKIHRAYI
ncbi:MAG TPA: hypothetical protein VIR98_02180 [Candidatus Paceibacterota bacterium]|jgi:hypothetical protein